MGEVVIVYAEGLLRVVSPLFDRCAVALTGERLILLAPGWPWGFRVRGTASLAECSIVRHRIKFDGSRLIVLRHGEEVRCLYFSRRWQKEADRIRVELAGGSEGFHTNVEALRELGALSGSAAEPVPVLLPGQDHEGGPP